MLAPLTVPQIIVVSTAFVTVIYSPIRAPRDALRTCYFTVCCRLYSPFPLVRSSGKGKKPFLYRHPVNRCLRQIIEIFSGSGIQGNAVQWKPLSADAAVGYIRQPEFLTFHVRLHCLIYMFLILHIADGIAVFCRKPSIAFDQSDIVLQHLLIRQIHTVHRTHMYPGLNRLRDIFKYNPESQEIQAYEKLHNKHALSAWHSPEAYCRSPGHRGSPPLCPQILQTDQFDAKSGYAVLHGSCLCRIAGTV